MEEYGIEMIRAVKKSIIQFGLVGIPIKLISLKQQDPFRFNYLCPICHNRISYKKYCKNCNQEFSEKQLLKGYYISKSLGYKIFTKEEIEALKKVNDMPLVIEAFIPSEEIPFFLYETSYYVIPENKNALKPFVLLLKALELTNLVAVGKFVMRNRERLFILRAYNGRMILTTLVYPHRIRTISRLDKEVEINDNELNLAIEIVEKLKNSFNELVANGFTKDVLLEKFEEALKGKIETKIESKVEEFSKLQEMLKKSIEAIDKKKEEKVEKG